MLGGIGFNTFFLRNTDTLFMCDNNELVPLQSPNEHAVHIVDYNHASSVVAHPSQQQRAHPPLSRMRCLR